MSTLRLAFAGVLVSLAAVAVSAPASAHFVIDTSPIGADMNLSDTASVTAGTIFTGSVNGYAGSVIDIVSTVNVSTSNGNASIDGITPKHGTLIPITQLTFTPITGTFNEFSLRGALSSNLDQVIHVTVTDNLAQTFDFLITSNGDFPAIGLTAEPTNEIIKKIVVTGSFADIKQVGFGYEAVTAVPEPSTWAMMVLGFAGRWLHGLSPQEPGSGTALGLISSNIIFEGRPCGGLSSFGELQDMQ
ncbi:PEP-CTERM protein-sorting domain-containing protein [Bradyrhizobium erythrophlei]|nr:PEP-CTERM protein-sorting domain-containing protein [Bradyrhizobium erythrophlei]